MHRRQSISVASAYLFCLYVSLPMVRADGIKTVTVTCSTKTESVQLCNLLNFTGTNSCPFAHPSYTYPLKKLMQKTIKFDQLLQIDNSQYHSVSLSVTCPRGFSTRSLKSTDCALCYPVTAEFSNNLHTVALYSSAVRAEFTTPCENGEDNRVEELSIAKSLLQATDVHRKAACAAQSTVVVNPSKSQEYTFHSGNGKFTAKSKCKADIIIDANDLHDPSSQQTVLMMQVHFTKPADSSQHHGLSITCKSSPKSTATSYITPNTMRKYDSTKNIPLCPLLIPVDDSCTIAYKAPQNKGAGALSVTIKSAIWDLSKNTTESVLRDLTAQFNAAPDVLGVATCMDPVGNSKRSINAHSATALELSLPRGTLSRRSVTEVDAARKALWQTIAAEKARIFRLSKASGRRSSEPCSDFNENANECTSVHRLCVHNGTACYDQPACRHDPQTFEEDPKKIKRDCPTYGCKWTELSDDRTTLQSHPEVNPPQNYGICDYDWCTIDDATACKGSSLCKWNPLGNGKCTDNINCNDFDNHPDICKSDQFNNYPCQYLHDGIVNGTEMCYDYERNECSDISSRAICMDANSPCVYKKIGCTDWDPENWCPLFEASSCPTAGASDYSGWPAGLQCAVYEGWCEKKRPPSPTIRERCEKEFRTNSSVNRCISNLDLQKASGILRQVAEDEYKATENTDTQCKEKLTAGIQELANSLETISRTLKHRLQKQRSDEGIDMAAWYAQFTSYEQLETHCRNTRNDFRTGAPHVNATQLRNACESADAALSALATDMLNNDALVVDKDTSLAMTSDSVRALGNYHTSNPTVTISSCIGLDVAESVLGYREPPGKVATLCNDDAGVILTIQYSMADVLKTAFLNTNPQGNYVPSPPSAAAGDAKIQKKHYSKSKTLQAKAAASPDRRSSAETVSKASCALNAKVQTNPELGELLSLRKLYMAENATQQYGCADAYATNLYYTTYEEYVNATAAGQPNECQAVNGVTGNCYVCNNGIPADNEQQCPSRENDGQYRYIIYGGDWIKFKEIWKSQNPRSTNAAQQPTSETITKLLKDFTTVDEKCSVTKGAYQQLACCSRTSAP